MNTSEELLSLLAGSLYRAAPSLREATATRRAATATTAKPKPVAGKPGLKKTIQKEANKPEKSYHGPGATKRPSPAWKATKKGGERPSARAMYDMGFTGSVVYDDKLYTMAFRNNGSPYWKPSKPSS